jgi:hypothetical protein
VDGGCKGVGDSGFYGVFGSGKVSVMADGGGEGSHGDFPVVLVVLLVMVTLMVVVVAL